MRPHCLQATLATLTHRAPLASRGAPLAACLAASLGACSEGFHSVGFYDRIDTQIAGGKTVAVLGLGDL